MSGQCEVRSGYAFSQADERIDADKLNSLGMPSVQVGVGAITSREIAPGAINSDKLDVDLSAQLGVPTNSVTTEKIVNGAVTESKLADGIVGGNKLKSTVITDLTEATSLADVDWVIAHRITAGGPPVKVSMANALKRGYALLRDEQADNVDGGTFTAASWVTRVLNTQAINVNSCVSALAANAFTLPAGTYIITGRAPAFSVNFHQCRLWNVTDAAQLALGTTEHSGSGQTTSIVTARVALDGSKQFRLEHRCSSTQNTTGLGNAANFGVGEVYAQVEIWRVW